jgi:hypothetical protein
MPTYAQMSLIRTAHESALLAYWSVLPRPRAVGGRRRETGRPPHPGALGQRRPSRDRARLRTNSRAKVSISMPNTTKLACWTHLFGPALSALTCSAIGLYSVRRAASWTKNVSVNSSQTCVPTVKVLSAQAREAALPRRWVHRPRPQHSRCGHGSCGAPWRPGRAGTVGTRRASGRRMRSPGRPSG